MTSTLHAVAWTLIHFCWQAAAVAAVYGLINSVLAKRSSQARYVLALLSLLLLLGAAVGTFAWEMRSATSSAATSLMETNGARTESEQEYPRRVSPGHPATDPSNARFSIYPFIPLIDGLWMLGVVALSVRSLGGWWVIQRLRNSTAIEAPAAVCDSFRRISKSLGLRRPVLLRVSSVISGPVTVGALRSLVLLPLSAASSLSVEELEVVLAHELAHVRRADFFWNLIQTFVETLFFFHPAVWWISGRVRHERELCCDDLALQICPNPIVYAHALFRLEQQRSRGMQLTMALDGHEPANTLRMRIARILGESESKIVTSRRPLSLAAVFAGLIVLLLPVSQVVSGLAPKAEAIASPNLNIEPSPRIGAAAIHGAVIAPTKHSLLAPVPMIQSAQPVPRKSTSAPAESKGDYIDQMKAAGYDVDLDKYVAMKIQDVTPEFARKMSEVGFGKLSADDLVACRIHGVTPEYLASLKQSGFEVKTLQDAISYRIFEVTPEFVSGMKVAGFENLSSKQLLELRVQNVTPEYAKLITQQFPGATIEDVVKTRIFNIDESFIASAKRHGFNDLTLDKLVKLRISGILDEGESK